MRLDAFDARRRRGRGLRTFLAFILAVALVGASLVLIRTGDPPELELDVALPALGPKTRIRVSARETKRGLTALAVRVRQGDASRVLSESTWAPRPPWAFWGPMTDVATVEIDLEKSELPALRESTAVIEVVASGAGTALLSAPTSSIARTFEVRLSPPRVAVLSENVFVAQGGAEAVVYAVSGPAVARHGVQAGEWFFPGYPLPGGESTDHFALFAVPYDLDDVSDVELLAEDDVGNVATAAFIDRFTPRPFKTDTIEVDDRIMEAVVPHILAKTPELEDRGNLLDNYVAINAELRKRNAETLVELAKKSEPGFAWNQTFVQMSAKVVSAFADRRTYFYKGRKIDQQDHLGFDLASVKKAPVPAANAGRVVFADYLGIYGNTVVIDHGYGLQSLYAHLSKIDVAVGDNVERAQIIGRTGATGLALGDHLHFTLLLQGLPITPIEWWDGHWLHDRLALKLGDALGFAGGGSRVD